MRISYTWSKAIDNVSEFFFSSPINNFNFTVDRSRSDDDQRHRVVFNATRKFSRLSSPQFCRSHNSRLAVKRNSPVLFAPSVQHRDRGEYKTGDRAASLCSGV